MPDREKVISTLEEIKTQTAGIGLDSAVIAHQFIDKIIALLKEQEAKPVLNQNDSMGYATCPSCKKIVIKQQIDFSPTKYCGRCGQAVKWE